MKGAGEPLGVPEDEGDIGLLEDAVLHEGLSLRYGDDLCQQVGQPDGVYEVKIAESFQLVVVMEDGSVVVEKLGRCVCVCMCVCVCACVHTC